jgi:hypothetical protein
MKTSIAGLLALGVFITPALAEQRYDRRLEAAAVGIVAGKMGALRGGYDSREKPTFVAPVDRSKPTYLSAKPSTPPADPEPGRSSRHESFVSF